MVKLLCLLACELHTCYKEYNNYYCVKINGHHLLTILEDNFCIVHIVADIKALTFHRPIQCVLLLLHTIISLDAQDMVL